MIAVVFPILQPLVQTKTLPAYCCLSVGWPFSMVTLLQSHRNFTKNTPARGYFLFYLP